MRDRDSGRDRDRDRDRGKTRQRPAPKSPEGRRGQARRKAGRTPPAPAAPGGRTGRWRIARWARRPNRCRQPGAQDPFDSPTPRGPCSTATQQDQGVGMAKANAQSGRALGRGGGGEARRGAVGPLGGEMDFAAKAATEVAYRAGQSRAAARPKRPGRRPSRRSGQSDTTVRPKVAHYYGVGVAAKPSGCSRCPGRFNGHVL
jgi:hypothetical protein